jgi:Domain of unknown function (DUF397)
MDAPDFDLSRAMWRTSSYSNNGGACVEVADNQPGIVAVRDSRDRTGPVLVLTPTQWRTFTASLRTHHAHADG